MNIYYVYIYYCNNDIPFYVGYGKNDRMFFHLKEAKKNLKPLAGQHKLNKIKKILKEGFEPRIEIVQKNLSKNEACNLEINLIKKYGRSDLGLGPLTNMTNGGDGVVEWNAEMRMRMSEKRRGIITAKDLKTGKIVRIKSDDPLWISGELVGINHGLIGVINKTGKLNNHILAKNTKTGEIFRVKSDDPRWVSGELVGFNHGKKCPKNTKIAASKRWKGVKKSAEQNKKNSESIKLLKWYCNFDTNKMGRFKENKQPSNYVRVSGPHKRTVIQ